MSQLGIYISVLLLLITLVFGVNKGNASRWIMGFQPSDFAKVVCVIYVARMVVLKKKYIKNFKEGIVPIVWPVILICSLIVPADFSTAALLFTVCFILIFVAGGKGDTFTFNCCWSNIAFFGMALLLNIAVPGLLPRVDTWSKRLTSFESGLEEENYQAQLALRAVANGSVMGKGPGNGTIKNNLYSAQSDFIFSSSVEEFGSIFGGVGVIFLYLVLLLG